MKKSKVLAKSVLQLSTGEILIIRRSNTAPRRPLQWDLPGGNVEENEDFVSAAGREIEEEVGIIIEPQHLHLTYTTTEMKEFSNVCWLYFIGRINTNIVKLSFEHDRAEWVNLNKAIEMTEYTRQRKMLLYLKDHQLLS